MRWEDDYGWHTGKNCRDLFEGTFPALVWLSYRFTLPCNCNEGSVRCCCIVHTHTPFTPTMAELSVSWGNFPKLSVLYTAKWGLTEKFSQWTVVVFLYMESSWNSEKHITCTDILIGFHSAYNLHYATVHRIWHHNGICHRHKRGSHAASYTFVMLLASSVFIWWEWWVRRGQATKLPQWGPPGGGGEERAYPYLYYSRFSNQGRVRWNREDHAF
jgi:hypothetical protein